MRRSVASAGPSVAPEPPGGSHVGTWDPDPSARFVRRLGKSAAELGHSDDEDKCPDIWQLSNGDIAVIGRDLTAAYAAGLPDGVALGSDERLVVIPGTMLSAAKADIPDA